MRFWIVISVSMNRKPIAFASSTPMVDLPQPGIPIKIMFFMLTRPSTELPCYAVEAHGRNGVEVRTGDVTRLVLIIRLTAYHCRVVAAQGQRRVVYLHVVVVRALLEHAPQPGIRRNSACESQRLVAALLRRRDELLRENIRNGILEARCKAVDVDLLALLPGVVYEIYDRGFQP